MPRNLKSGESKWVAGGYTHTLTNIGKQPAKVCDSRVPVIQRRTEYSHA